jgi:hypothetical protein
MVLSMPPRRIVVIIEDNRYDCISNNRVEHVVIDVKPWLVIVGTLMTALQTLNVYTLMVTR